MLSADAHQLAAYDEYREWERRDPAEEDGAFGRMFVLDTCPKHLRPEYKTASKARGAGFYFPEAAGSSIIRLVGLDKDPHGLRGRASDGDDLSEAAFIRHLTHAVKNVLYPQYQGRPWARMCLESSAPEEPDTEWDTVFVADARIRGAYSFATIEENTRLGERERNEFIRAEGGRGDPDCEREYYGKRARPGEVVVIPAFDPERHVAPLQTPEWALCYTIGDAGYHPDFFAILFGWVDYENARLCVKADWLAHNAGTDQVAKAIKDGEAATFTGIRRWNGRVCQQWGPPERQQHGVYVDQETLDRELAADRQHHRPYARVLDGEPRLRGDLARMDGLAFVPANNVDPDAQFHRLNRLFVDDKARIDPGARAVIAHTQAAFRDDRGNLARSDTHGHFDAMRCLAYFAVMADLHTDPKAPSWALDPAQVRTPAMERQRESTATKALNRMVKPTRWKPNPAAQWRAR